jgi:hypothetical protein
MEYAFETNSLASSKFPLSYIQNNFENYQSLNIAALSLTEIVDLIVEYAFENLLIFGVDNLHFNKSNDVLMTISEIADENKLRYIKYDNNNIIINKNELGKLINFNHYNFKILDMATIPNELEYIELIDNIEMKYKYEGVERIIHNSNLWIDIHDDCYLYTESKYIDYIMKIKVRAIKSNINNHNIEITFDKIVFNFLKKNNLITIFNEGKMDNKLITFPIIYQGFPWSNKKAEMCNITNYLVYEMDKNIVLII